MADTLGRNIALPIYNADGTSFHNLILRKPVFDSVVMSLGDKLTGDVYYIDSSLDCTMQEYVVYNNTKYVLVNPPTIVREGMVADNSELKGMTKYSFEFYHPMYMLGNFPFTDIAVSYDEMRYKSQDKNFYWIGYISDFINKLNKNLQGTEWVCRLSDSIGIDKLEKLSDVLSFDNNTIADALKTAYETWEVPFVIDNVDSDDEDYDNGKRFLILFGLPSNEIYASDAARQAGTPFVFKFGQGVGLKNNSATPKNNKIITRIAGYGSENNIPYGYPQIVWTGNQSWTNTKNDDTDPTGYPIYDGIVGGRYVKLIKHPFTRTHLMPSIYTETVNKKVNPYADGYNPDIEIKDYYDADDSSIYPHTINLAAPSYEIHGFDDIKPELGEQYIISATPIDNNGEVQDEWIDDIDDDGNYLQSYFKIKLPILGFDLYACAAITEEMQINMRGGACLGCTFEVQVDWEDYKRNFYDADLNFLPDGDQRDLTKYPDSRTEQIEIIVQKDTSTFGTLMPNKYQYPIGGDAFVVLGISLPTTYITNAEQRLDEAMREYMLENNVYYFEYPLKFDEYFLTTHTYILSQIKNNTIVRFEFQGQNIPLYIKQLTIKYGEYPLPEYNITLTDDVEIVLNQIGQVTEDVSRMRLQVSALQAYFDKNIINEINNKLSKVQDDTARGKIRFMQGYEVGEFIHDSTGASLSITNDGTTTLELDFLTVRRAAKFREITIQELKHIGGEIALTAAAMECSKVETVESNGAVVGYKCYFETTDGDKTIYQEFVVGDQARCQQFRLEESSDGYQSTKYYWRIVKEIGENYIVLSNVADEYDGTSIPAVGDKIVQLGYRKSYNNNQDIPYRTTAIILSATTDDAPSTKYYEGITTFSLGNVVKDEGYANGSFHSNVYGTTYVGAPDHSSYMAYAPNDGLSLSGTLQVGTTLQDGTDVNNLASANINLLLNTGFTGDYQSIDVSDSLPVDSDTVVYSPSFIHWDYNNGCLIRASVDSASGYECYMGSIGRLSQTISNLERNNTFVVSLKASGDDVTVSFGGSTKTFELSDTPRYFAFKVANPVNSVFTLTTSGGCVICEPMVAVGNVFDTWSRSPIDNDKAIGEIYAFDYLMNALTQASTTINKGLLLTQLIKVGNYRNGTMIEETGGMSGLVTDENYGNTDPFIWGGGTMNQALYAIMKYDKDPSYEATDEEIAQMAKFVVTHGGRAILNDIVLRGYIYAQGGVFHNVKSPNGNFYIDDNGDLFVSNSGRIAGFYVEGDQLTNKSANSTFRTDATIVFRNDTTNKFAAMGGMVFDVSSGISAIARFENHDQNSLLSANSAMYVSARNGINKNAAILLGGGCISGLAYDVEIIDLSSSNQTIKLGTNVAVCIKANTNHMVVNLPDSQIQSYHDGYVIKIKNDCNYSIDIQTTKLFDVIKNSNYTNTYELGSRTSITFVYCDKLTISNITGIWIALNEI